MGKLRMTNGGESLALAALALVLLLAALFSLALRLPPAIQLHS